MNDWFESKLDEDYFVQGLEELKYNTSGGHQATLGWFIGSH